MNFSGERRPLGWTTEVHAADLVLGPLKGCARRWVISLHSGKGATYAAFGVVRVNSCSEVVQHGGPIGTCSADGTEKSAEGEVGVGMAEPLLGLTAARCPFSPPVKSLA